MMLMVTYVAHYLSYLQTLKQNMVAHKYITNKH